MTTQDFETVRGAIDAVLLDPENEGNGLFITRGQVHLLGRGLDALSRIEERVRELERIKEAAREVETYAFRQYLDWMHFHELAMDKPFEAEAEAQDFARRVSSLLTIALEDFSTIKVVESTSHLPISCPTEPSGSGEDLF